MATLNAVTNKKYTQNAGSYFPLLKAEDIQKISDWLKRHNFHIEEKNFKDGSTTIAIGRKDQSGIFYEVISPLVQTESALEGQFTGQDLIEFINAAGSKTLEGRAKKVMERVIGINPSAAEDVTKDDPLGMVLVALQDSHYLENDYSMFWKMLVDRDIARDHAEIDAVNADPRKVAGIIASMENKNHMIEQIREKWAKQRQEDLEKQDEEEYEAS